MFIRVIDAKEKSPIQYMTSNKKGSIYQQEVVDKKTEARVEFEEILKECSKKYE